jgi:hypothetical protein
LLSNDVAENPGPDNKVGDLTAFVILEVIYRWRRLEAKISRLFYVM